MKNSLRPVALIPAFILAQALFVAAYVAHEHTIYFWDHAMYFAMARQGFQAFAGGFGAGAAVFGAALANNYNLIYALPSYIGFALFGVSRAVFILANFLIFFVAYEVACAFMLRRALGLDWLKALAFSLVACSLIPPLWVPLLEGYPDTGAAACVVFAFGLALTGVEAQKFIRRALGIGLLLGLAVLLRRHFIYPALALLVTAGLFALEPLLHLETARARWRYVGRCVVYFAVAGAALASLLALVAPEFLARALTVDYTGLYDSYKKPALTFVRFAAAGFGFLLLAAAAGGLFLLARMKKDARRLALFTSVFTLIWLVFWCLGPDEMSHHYILHALPLLAVVGLAGWLVYLTKKPTPIKYLAALALLIVLAANSAWALWFSPRSLPPNDNGAPGLLASPRPPVIRPDYDELVRLAKYLALTTMPHDHILALGSSFVFNQDILHSVYSDVFDAGDMVYRFLQAPEVDRIQPPPLDAFASADVYVVPTPAQYHLDPAGQHVVTAAANQFPPPASRRDLFAVDDQTFHLMNGVSVTIWRRKPWTPDQLHAALRDIRRDSAEENLFHQDWVAVTLPLRTDSATDREDRSAAVGIFGPGRDAMDLLFDFPLPAGRYRLAFATAAEQGCDDPRFHLAALTGGGRVVMNRDFAAPLSGETFQPVDLPQGGGAYFLRLGLTLKPDRLCRAGVQNLRVERAR